MSRRSVDDPAEYTVIIVGLWVIWGVEWNLILHQNNSPACLSGKYGGEKKTQQKLTCVINLKGGNKIKHI